MKKFILSLFVFAAISSPSFYAMRVAPKLDQTAHTSYSGKNVRNKFLPDEDKLLYDLVNRLGTKNWNQIGEHFPRHTARACRDRYNFYLSARMGNHEWTKEEDILLLQKYNELGPKWIKIKDFLNGRSSSGVRQRTLKLLERSGLRPQLRHVNHTPTILERPNNNFILRGSIPAMQNLQTSNRHAGFTVNSELPPPAPVQAPPPPSLIAPDPGPAPDLTGIEDGQYSAQAQNSMGGLFDMYEPLFWKDDDVDTFGPYFDDFMF